MFCPGYPKHKVTMTRKRILLLSAYDAVSHRQWRQGLVSALPQYDWTVLTLPPRHFSWRIRGNGLSWAMGQRATLAQVYDLVLATSMVDLATLRGLVPELATLPSVLYFHENQFAYPQTSAAHASLEPRMVNLYSALAADCLVFNSDYNRTSFLTGVENLLSRLPDAVPPGIEQQLAEKARVIPVPLATEVINIRSGPRPEQFTLVWNHRWEYDKAPERFFAALVNLAEQGVVFRVHVLGQQFRHVPSLFNTMRQVLDDYIHHWGWLESRLEYLKILRESHIAVSTALHDFQGVALQEAVAAGCLPVVPDRLSYPEFYTATYRYASIPEDSDAEVQALTDHLMNRVGQHEQGKLPAPPHLGCLSWDRMQPIYLKLLNEVAA